MIAKQKSTWKASRKVCNSELAAWCRVFRVMELRDMRHWKLYHAFPWAEWRRCYRRRIGICDADVQCMKVFLQMGRSPFVLTALHREVVNGYNADDSLPRMPEEQWRASEKHYGSSSAHCFISVRDMMYHPIMLPPADMLLPEQGN